MENINVKETGQAALKWTVVGLSSVYAVHSIAQLIKVKSISEGFVPAGILLLCVTAFSSAMRGDKVTFVPIVSKPAATTTTSGADGYLNAGGKRNSLIGIGKRKLTGFCADTHTPPCVLKNGDIFG